MRDIERYSDNYFVQDFELYQVEYRRKMIIEQINKYCSKRILEIGCGCEPLFQHVGNKDWVIVEPSELFCELAQKKAEGREHICILQCFFEDCAEKLAKESFDMIICSGLLHEVEEPKRMLESIWAICGENTIVHVNVPNANSFHRILAKNMNIISDVHEKSERNIMFQQNTVFDMDELTEMLTRCGYTILDKGSCLIKPFTHKQMYEMIEKEIINKEVLDGLDYMVRDFPQMGSEIFVNCKKLSIKKTIIEKGSLK